MASQFSAKFSSVVCVGACMSVCENQFLHVCHSLIADYWYWVRYKHDKGVCLKCKDYQERGQRVCVCVCVCVRACVYVCVKPMQSFYVVRVS